MTKSNKPWLMVWLFYLLLALCSLFAGYNLAGRGGLLVGFMISVIGLGLVFLRGDSRLLSDYPEKPLCGQDPWGVLPWVARFSRHLEIETPEVQIIDTEKPICFAVPSFFSVDRIGVSKGVLDRLSTQEKEALFVDLCCQLRNSHSFVFMTTTVLVNTMLAYPDVASKTLAKMRLAPSFVTARTFLTWSTVLLSAVGLILLRMHILLELSLFFLLLPILFLMPLVICKLGIQLSRRKNSYFEIDNLCTQLLHNKTALAAALWKLESLNITNPTTPALGTEHYFLSNPHASAKYWTMINVHPKISDRLKNLVGYFPL